MVRHAFISMQNMGEMRQGRSACGYVRRQWGLRVVRPLLTVGDPCMHPHIEDKAMLADSLGVGDPW